MGANLSHLQTPICSCWVEFTTAKILEGAKRTLTIDLKEAASKFAAKVGNIAVPEPVHERQGRCSCMVLMFQCSLFLFFLKKLCICFEPVQTFSARAVHEYFISSSSLSSLILSPFKIVHELDKTASPSSSAISCACFQVLVDILVPVFDSMGYL